jgi:hypothetical protein
VQARTKLDPSCQEKKNAEIEGYQNKAMRTLGPKGKEERGEWRKPSNAKLHSL